MSKHINEESGWYLDVPDIRLTKIFTIVFILHAIAIGGIIAFKMLDVEKQPSVVGKIQNTSD